MPLCFLCALVPYCVETASVSQGSKSHCLLLLYLHMLTPHLLHVPVLFSHWGFINGLFLFAVLLIQKSDPEKHDLFLTKQRALDQDYSKRKKLPALYNEFMFHISLNLMLFWYFYRSRKKSSPEIPCQLCILSLNPASGKVADKTTLGMIVFLKVGENISQRNIYSDSLSRNRELIYSSSQRISVWARAHQLTATTHCRVLL